MNTKVREFKGGLGPKALRSGTKLAGEKSMKNTIALILFAFSMNTFAQTAVREFCEELPIDGTIRVAVTQSRSKTRVEQKYSLRRASRNVYDVFLNLEFKPARSYDGSPEERVQLNNHYRNRMNSCFREFDFALKDEHDRKLRLHIYNQGIHQLQDAPPLVKIKVEGGRHRSNSGAYARHIDCPTMIHEAFHLLGLVDEYEEKWMGYNHNFFSLGFRPYLEVDNQRVKPAFDCRAISPIESMMHNHNYLGRGQSMYSAHANMIIYPNCFEKNEKYISCAKFAYKTSFRNNNGAVALRDCSRRIPDYCKTDEWLKVDRLD